LAGVGEDCSLDGVWFDAGAGELLGQGAAALGGVVGVFCERGVVLIGVLGGGEQEGGVGLAAASARVLRLGLWGVEGARFTTLGEGSGIVGVDSVAGGGPRCGSGRWRGRRRGRGHARRRRSPMRVGCPWELLAPTIGRGGQLRARRGRWRVRHRVGRSVAGWCARFGLGRRGVVVGAGVRVLRRRDRRRSPRGGSCRRTLRRCRLAREWTCVGSYRWRSSGRLTAPGLRSCR